MCAAANQRPEDHFGTSHQCDQRRRRTGSRCYQDEGTGLQTNPNQGPPHRGGRANRHADCDLQHQRQCDHARDRVYQQGHGYADGRADEAPSNGGNGCCDVLLRNDQGRDRGPEGCCNPTSVAMPYANDALLAQRITNRLRSDASSTRRVRLATPSITRHARAFEK